MPLPCGPGQIVSVDYFGPLPITRNGNKHILLYTDRFSRYIAAYAVTQDKRTAEGTARIFVEQYIPLWGCPHTLLSDNGSEFVARLSLAIYKLMRIPKHWHRCYLWLLVSNRMTGMSGCPMSFKHTTIQSLQRQDWRRMRYI